MAQVFGTQQDVYFGSVEDSQVDWRASDMDETDPDDEVMAETPADVVSMLGFDPLELDDEEGGKVAESAAWDENEHPRASDGKFTDGSSSGPKFHGDSEVAAKVWDKATANVPKALLDKLDISSFAIGRAPGEQADVGGKIAGGSVWVDGSNHQTALHEIMHRLDNRLYEDPSTSEEMKDLLRTLRDSDAMKSITPRERAAVLLEGIYSEPGSRPYDWVREKFPDEVAKAQQIIDRYVGGSGDDHPVKFESIETQASLPAKDVDVVRKAITRVEKEFPQVGKLRRVAIGGAADTVKVWGTKSNDTIYLNSMVCDPEEQRKHEQDWKGCIIGDGSLESTIAHEYGHIIAGRALNTDDTRFNREVLGYAMEEVSYDPGYGEKRTAKRYEIDTLDGKSFYSQEDPGEFLAECVSDVLINGAGASETAKEVVKRLKEVLG